MMIAAVLEAPQETFPDIIPLATDPLDDLLLRVATGDRAALKSLYNAIAPRLFAVLVRMVKRQEVAEDLLQDTFVTIWKKAHQFDATRGNARAWLFSITRRKAIDRLRTIHRECLGIDDDYASTEPDLAEWAPQLDSETRITIRRALGTLKPDVCKAMKLCYFHGLTHEELALEMRVPLGTVKSWVRRGLAQLKICMTPK